MPKPNSDNPYSRYARYSAIVIEMIAVIAGLTYLGVWADKKIGNETAWLTIVLSLLGVAAAIYLLIKQLPRE
ncbi:MAG TPA: AtpZ/AtpI family protein [Bacteroidales bacterium]|nr:AtpZ/AtpI family protein [Bacteroidales bacterium]HOE05100.1 AtpZ/AtpI family protein [Bacteroidales bacterium]